MHDPYSREDVLKMEMGNLAKKGINGPMRPVNNTTKMSFHDHGRNQI